MTKKKLSPKRARKPKQSGVCTTAGQTSAQAKTAKTELESPEPTPLRVTAAFARVWDGAGGISEDAELGDVLLEMFTDSYSGDEEPRTSFLDVVVRSACDELAMLELAQSAGNVCAEAPRILERIRSRIIVARWLDARTTVVHPDGPEADEVTP